MERGSLRWMRMSGVRVKTLRVSALCAVLLLVLAAQAGAVKSTLETLGVTATGLFSINVAFTGFCPVGNILKVAGLTPMLGDDSSRLYFLQTDRWYLERQIYLAVGKSIFLLPRC